MALPVEGIEAAEGQTMMEVEREWAAAVARVAEEADEEAEDLCVSLAVAAEAAVNEALQLQSEATEGDVDVSWMLDMAECDAENQACSRTEQADSAAQEASVPASLETGTEQLDTIAASSSHSSSEAFEEPQESLVDTGETSDALCDGCERDAPQQEPVAPVAEDLAINLQQG